ncbi:hypothetical protein SDC9_92536 [bioreactor metagenome]|uniref:Uncharacterized protein n=1 Tax=bioreactor metagenome TaxID=1076179 RepID=A0A645A7X2_9ZZZZ
MEKIKLLLIALSPILIGFLFNNLLIFLPLFIYIAPFLMMFYWFWVGTQFAENVKSPAKAILLANSIGIISLLVYYWQFVMVADNERILVLAGFSQMFTVPLIYLTAKIGLIFQQTPNEIIQVTGFILMLIVFTIGYFYKKKLLKQHS